MASHYTVVRYLPDPLTEESINIGVIAYGDGIIRSRFVSDWRRVRSFGGEGIKFLKDFAREIEHAELTSILGQEGGEITEKDLHRIAHQWINSIRFSPPKASIKPPDALL